METELTSLLSFKEGAGASREEHQALFSNLAATIINNYRLFVDGVPYILAEIEFYYCGPGHEDVFAHCDEKQLTSAQWYFHRSGKSYKTGTYKGLDITFGPRTHFGGILIRAIQSPAGEYIEGSCSIVDHIFSRVSLPNGSKVNEVAEFVTHPRFLLEVEDPTNVLHLERLHPPSKFKINSSSRVGLTLKQKNGDRPWFITQHYRFLAFPNLVSKGRPNLILSLCQQGLSIDSIIERTGATAATVRKYIASMESGASKSISAFAGKAMKVDDLCALHGACNPIRR